MKSKQTLRIRMGDCRDVMKTLEPNSVEAIVSDPPYGLSFMGNANKWDAPWKEGDAFDGMSAMEGFQAWCETWLADCYRVLKPGGVIKLFGATRVFHRLAKAMENSGYEDLDLEVWVYGCLSEDTEVLTTVGWKLGVDVKKGDWISCWDPKTEKVAYHRVEKHTCYPHTGEMVRFESRDMDALVTPNHRVYHLKGKSGWQVTEAGGLIASNVDLPVPGDQSGTTTEIVRAMGMPEDYDGLVWCVQVPTGAFVARRAGKSSFITGNSGFPKSMSMQKQFTKLAGNVEDSSESETFEKAAETFDGFGTALKPAFEPFVTGVKPVSDETAL